MSTVKGLMLAIEAAQRAREHATADLLRVMQATRSAQSQMDQLEHYALETEAKWGTASLRVSSAELMRHHYQFLNRLQHAIGLQRLTLGQLADQTVAAQSALLQIDLRLASLQKIDARQRAAQAAAANRQEQRQMDELASLQFSKHSKYSIAGDLP